MEPTVQKAYSSEEAKTFIEKTFDESALPSLMEFIRIPNLSRTYSNTWQTDGFPEQAANHLKKWVESMQVNGLKIEIIKHENYSPLIFIEVEGDLKHTVMYYGHYDKQPPFTGWWENFGPTTPVIKDDKLYGRGGADDGYSIYGSILAIKSLQLQGIKIPRCVVIIEGDEESGSAHMFYYLDQLKERIGNPKLFFCLDSGALDYEHFWMTRSLRGNLVSTLTVQVLKEGIHSEASGIVPSPFRILRSLLERIECSKTGQIHEAFHVNIPSNRYKENFDLAKELNESQIGGGYPFLQGVQSMTNDPLGKLLNRGWKPMLAVIGATGMPDVSMAGNVLLPKISVRLTLRLPPTLNGDEARKNLEKLLLENPPYGAKVTLENVRCAKGWNCPEIEPFVQEAINTASKQFYGKDSLCLGEGGSIPLMGKLTEIWPKGQFIITGVLGPNANAHGPNEMLHLPFTKKLICSMSLILAKVAEHYSK